MNRLSVGLGLGLLVGISISSFIRESVMLIGVADETTAGPVVNNVNRDLQNSDDDSQQQRANHLGDIEETRTDRTSNESTHRETSSLSGDQFAAAGNAEINETPIGKKWWPSKWGADDQRGAANLMTSDRALEAARLITTGKVFQLGRVYERDMPTFPHRTFRLTIPAFRSARGANQQVGRDEFFVGEIGQMGTQMDGLGHVGCRLPDGDTYYNGVKSSDMEDAYGLTKLGIENVGTFFTRGVLVDVVGARKTDRLPIG
ncbi:MAG: hypothetical protein FJ267_19340, partial [Planctomycetes bacterium]|nr:hypothetical protein [Planctomycetota bacterium]